MSDQKPGAELREFLKDKAWLTEMLESIEAYLRDRDILPVQQRIIVDKQIEYLKELRAQLRVAGWPPPSAISPKGKKRRRAQ